MPSSPNGPCRTGNTTSAPSRPRPGRHRELLAVAAPHAVAADLDADDLVAGLAPGRRAPTRADASETSCSDERPPARTATLIRPASRRRSASASSSAVVSSPTDDRHRRAPRRVAAAARRPARSTIPSCVGSRRRRRARPRPASPRRRARSPPRASDSPTASGTSTCGGAWATTIVTVEPARSTSVAAAGSLAQITRARVGVRRSPARRRSPGGPRPRCAATGGVLVLARRRRARGPARARWRRTSVTVEPRSTSRARRPAASRSRGPRTDVSTPARVVVDLEARPPSSACLAALLGSCRRRRAPPTCAGPAGDDERHRRALVDLLARLRVLAQHAVLGRRRSCTRCDVDLEALFAARRSPPRADARPRSGTRLLIGRARRDSARRARRRRAAARARRARSTASVLRLALLVLGRRRIAAA